MKRNAVQYTCVTCGICCKGRLVPLTVDEAVNWLERGDEVAVILEAFSLATGPEQSPEYLHNVGRAASVKAGNTQINVIAIFTGNALNQCPNLREDNLCGIYLERPLVCRIYPMEINPFIELRQENKICPPESWGSGEILCTDGIANPPLQLMIKQSREADVQDAEAKVAVCASLGLTVASWKGDGFAVYFPEREALLKAIQEKNVSSAINSSWSVRTDNSDLHQSLQDAGVPIAPAGAENYLYQAL